MILFFIVWSWIDSSKTQSEWLAMLCKKYMRGWVVNSVVQTIGMSCPNWWGSWPEVDHHTSGRVGLIPYGVTCAYNISVQIYM